MISDLETRVLGNARSPEPVGNLDGVHIDVCIVFSSYMIMTQQLCQYKFQVFEVLWDFSWILHSVTTFWCQVVQDDAWSCFLKKRWMCLMIDMKSMLHSKTANRVESRDPLTLCTRVGPKIYWLVSLWKGVAFLLLLQTHVSLSIMSSRIWVLHAKKRSKIDQRGEAKGEKRVPVQGMNPIMEKNLRYSQGTDKTALCALGGDLPCHHVKISELTPMEYDNFFFSCTVWKIGSVVTGNSLRVLLYCEMWKSLAALQGLEGGLTTFDKL